jgi:hypothetical protein
MKGSAGGRGGWCLHLDIEVGDVALLREQLQAIWIGDTGTAAAGEAWSLGGIAECGEDFRSEESERQRAEP